MLKLFGTVLIAGAVLMIAKAIFVSVWVAVRWNVFGIPPQILNEALVEEAVAMGAVQFDMDLVEMEKLGVEVAPEFKQQYLDARKVFLKSVIEKYIDLFARRG